MILSDVDILSRLRDGHLEVEPLGNIDRQIQPASIDLRLGREFLKFNRTNIPCIHPTKEQEVSEYITEQTVDEGEEFIVHPGDFILATTTETVNIPRDLIGHVEGRSSLGRLAIIVHSTAGIIDPGYHGEITLEISNLGVAPVALTPGMRIAQLTLTELSSPARRPYGEGRGSKYQNQTGPEASKISDDPEFSN